MKISWEEEKGILIAKVGDIEVGFNISDVFPGFEDLQGVPRKLVVYGLKQKLGDTLAKGRDYNLSPKEKAQILQEKFNDLKNGVWTRKPARKDAKAVLEDAIANIGLSKKELAIAKKLLEYLETKNKASKK